jgi:hypothetical protein
LCQSFAKISSFNEFIHLVIKNERMKLFQLCKRATQLNVPKYFVGFALYYPYGKGCEGKTK